MSIIKRITAIIKGWYYIYKDWRQKIPPELKQLFDDRLKTCKNCEYNKFNTCTQCGCFVYAKTKVTDQHCPENKWRPHLYSMNPMDDDIVLVEEVPTLLRPLFLKQFDASATVDEWEEFLNGLEKKNKA